MAAPLDPPLGLPPSHRYHDFDRSAILGLDEYMASVERLIDFSAKPGKAATYTSYDIKRCHWLRSVRVEAELQSSLKVSHTFE